jgi:hypothetical protein
MLCQASSRFDEGQIYISCTREEMDRISGVLTMKTTELTVHGTIEFGKITLTFMRSLDEEDKK